MLEVGKPWSHIILIRSEGCPGMGTEDNSNEESGTEKGRGRWERKKVRCESGACRGSLMVTTEHLRLCLDRAAVGWGPGSASAGLSLGESRDG